MRCEWWTTTRTTDDADNAFERAFASQSEHLMELLGLARCEASASFKERILCGPSLRDAFVATDVRKIRCLLRIFGAMTPFEATAPSFLNFESGSRYGRTRADAIAFTCLVEQAKVSSACRSPSLEKHWISALKDASIDDQINVLLAAGGIPSLAREKTWLLMNAIIENKSLRLTLLLACVPPSYPIDFKYFESTEPMILVLRAVVNAEVFVSPLCCAIIFQRHQMIKELLLAGAPVNAHGSSLGLLPLHFAAMADSFEIFDCLESHGADLEVRDTTGRNMIDILIATKIVGGRRRPEKSLSNYLIKNHELYSHYLWGAQLKALYLSSPRRIVLGDAGLLDWPEDKQWEKGTWRRRFLAAKPASVLGSAPQDLRERKNVCLKQTCISVREQSPPNRAGKYMNEGIHIYKWITSYKCEQIHHFKLEVWAVSFKYWVDIMPQMSIPSQSVVPQFTLLDSSFLFPKRALEFCCTSTKLYFNN